MLRYYVRYSLQCIFTQIQVITFLVFLFMLPFHETTWNAGTGFFLEIRDFFLKGMLKSLG